MMHGDEPAPAMRAFTDTLWGAWIKAGPISYSEFERLSKLVLGPAGYPMALR